MQDEKKVLLRELLTFLVRILECFLENGSRPDSLKKSPPILQRLNFFSQSILCLVSHLFASSIKNSEFKNKQHCTTATYIYIKKKKKTLLSQDTGFWKKKKKRIVS